MSPLIRVAVAINFISTSHSFKFFIKFLTLPHTLLKWTLYFIFQLLYYPFSYTVSVEKLNTCRHVPTYVSHEDEDCAVCLCKMVEREEEIITLRCQHVFHRDCFNTWVGFSNATNCPLCRDSVAPKRDMGVRELFSVDLFDSLLWRRNLPSFHDFYLSFLPTCALCH
ncbi:hypothetical protein VNO78_09580 [Psophocarpus tetragonolobus]|uniref:RING-type domain-containing protein n=1 Tax=Psophocarpus tetragonolobus TaxID=3891 RepID=A0AAN9SWD4_PSOTE